MTDFAENMKIGAKADTLSQESGREAYLNSKTWRLKLAHEFREVHSFLIADIPACSWLESTFLSLQPSLNWSRPSKKVKVKTRPYSPMQGRQ